MDEQTRQQLAERSVVGDPLTINRIDHPDVSCACVADHNPNEVQLHRHHIWPLGWSGPNQTDNIVLLCPTTHANIHRLLREYAKAGGEPSWDIRRWFGRYANEMAATGWAWYLAGRVGG